MLTHALHALAPLLALDAVIENVVGFLLVWALWSGAWLYYAAGRVARRFKQATARLGSGEAVEFASDYGAVDRDLAADDLLGPSWRAFRDTLIVPDGLGRPIAATVDPRGWFDLADLFRRSQADLRYHAALPGLLVGAGLLFTFLGLAAALSLAGDVVAGGADADRNRALHSLLGAASAKFLTSLAGLLFSILYALFRKAQLRRAEMAQSDFFEALRRLLPLHTPAALQAEANRLLERQYAEIQRIGGEFFVNLGSTLEREFGHGLQQHIGPLAAALEQLSTRLASQNEGAMQSMLQAFLQRLEGAVGGSTRGVAATLEALGSRLDGLQGGLDAAAQRMGRAAEEMAAGMGRGVEAALGGLGEQMAALLQSLRDAAEETGRSHRAAGEAAAEAMAATIRGAGDALQATSVEMAAALGAGAADVGTRVAALAAAAAALTEPLAALESLLGTAALPLATGAADLRAAGEAAREATRPLQEIARAAAGSLDAITAAATALASTQRGIEQLAGRIGVATDRFEGLDQNVAVTLRGLNDALQRYQGTIADFVREIDDGMSKNVQGLQAIAQTLQESVEELTDRRPAPVRARTP